MVTETLRFNTVLKEVPVFLTGVDKKEKKYFLRELTGNQRANYNSNFEDVKMEMDENGKPKAMSGIQFKLPSAVDFVSLCLFDDSSALVGKGFVGPLPSKVVTKLYEVGLELSGMNKDAIDAAKNELGESDSNGSE